MWHIYQTIHGNKNCQAFQNDGGQIISSIVKSVRYLKSSQST